MRKHEQNHLKQVPGGYEGVVYRYKLNAPGDEKDGWSYIGVTPEEELRRKMWNNPNNDYAGSKIANARKQYGLKNFSYSVLETLTDSDVDELENKLELKEAEYIEKYDSYLHGFNGNKGGCGRVEISRDEIKRTQAKRKDFHHTEATKIRISATLKGRTVSDEVKAKISKGNKGKKRTLEQRKAESARLKGIEPKAASEGARKWREANPGGYWKNHKLSDEAKANMKAAQQARGISIEATEPDGTQRDFNTLLDAAKYYKINVGSVGYSVEHGSTTRDGFKFKKKIA